MSTKIELIQYVAAPRRLRFVCHPEIRAQWPKLSEYAETVGCTSILELRVNRARIFAKLEWENSSGTVKDRAVLGMLHDLLLRGHQRPKRILEYTGGSLGLALASICHQLRIPMSLVLSESTPASVVGRLRLLDCELHIVDKEQGFWGVMNKAFELSRAHPEYSFLFQHENAANLNMHREFTGTEVLSQLDGADIDGWVAAVGTGGTYCGVLSALRRRFPKLKGYIVTPAEMPFGTESGPNSKPKFIGAGGLGYGKKQKFVTAIDPKATHFHFSYDQCRQMMLDFYLQTGLKIGSSAAANLLGCIKAAAEFGHEQLATVFPSKPSDEESVWLKTNKEVTHEHRSVNEEGCRTASAGRHLISSL